MPHRSKASAAGFTLLEVLVALVIFSMISIGAFRLLSSTGTLQERAQQRIDALAAVQRTMRQVERDLAQMAVLPSRAKLDQVDLPDGDAFSFDSHGWRNPQQHPRSQLQGVAWVLDSDGGLWRSRWPAGQEVYDEPLSQVVLNDVDSIDWRYQDEAGKWSERWPPAGSKPPEKGAPPLPRAIEVRLKSRLFGEVWRHVTVR